MELRERVVQIYVIQYSNINHKRYPFFLKCSTIIETESIGTAKLNPSAAATFITLIPTTSPSILARGPPELPYPKN